MPETLSFSFDTNINLSVYAHAESHLQALAAVTGVSVTFTPAPTEASIISAFVGEMEAAGEGLSLTVPAP